MSNMEQYGFEQEELDKKPQTKADKAFDNILEMLDAVVMAVFVMILLFTFLIRVVYVQGPSMNDTLHEGDLLLIDSLLYQPKQGDIVVIESEAFDETIIKRIIATEGQIVEIDYNGENGATLSVDGKIIDEQYLPEQMREATGYNMTYYDKEQNIYRYEVPFNCVFVLGDNRNNSTDSRAIGFVKENEIVGKVVFRLKSAEGSFGKVN